MNGKPFVSKKPPSVCLQAALAVAVNVFFPVMLSGVPCQQDELGQQTGAVAAAGGELWPCHGAAGRPAGVEAAAALPALQVLLQTG